MVDRDNKQDRSLSPWSLRNRRRGKHGTEIAKGQGGWPVVRAHLSYSLYTCMLTYSQTHKLRIMHHTEAYEPSWGRMLQHGQTGKEGLMLHISQEKRVFKGWKELLEFKKYQELKTKTSFTSPEKLSRHFLTLSTVHRLIWYIFNDVPKRLPKWEEFCPPAAGHCWLFIYQVLISWKYCKHS